MRNRLEARQHGVMTQPHEDLIFGAVARYFIGLLFEKY
jgi:hypothetical protein